MKRLFYFLVILLSSHYLLAQKPPKSGKSLQNNKKENHSDIGICPKENIPIEEHHVTVEEYCEFLNAVATSDSHHLYDECMGSDPDTACIIRSGTPANYSYSAVEGQGELPISQVNLLDKARYCNWLEQGKPTGDQSAETTEDGVYTLNGDKIVAINAEATYLLKDNNNQVAGTNQVIGCRLQVVGANQAADQTVSSRRTELPLGEIRQQAEPTTNCELRTANCNNQGDDLDCYLMMEPAAIEEAGKALKRELGISEEKESLISPSEFTENPTNFTTLSAFTIVKKHTAASNTISSSHEPINETLKKQTEQAIQKSISHSSTQLQDHYKKADEAWAEYDRGWKERSHLYHELQESRRQLTLSEQKLEQANLATTSEELEKTRLGKIAKYAGIACDALAYLPEPHAQVASAGISQLAGFADTINSTWAKVNLLLVKREHQQIEAQHKQAQERKDQAHQQLFPLEQRAEQIETLASIQAEQATKKLAEQLHPQTDWRDSHWQAWGTIVGSGWSEKEKMHLTDQARSDLNWIEEVTKKSWEQKIETGKEQYLALQKKANLTSLKRHYDSAVQQHERAKTQEEQQRRYLDQSQHAVEDLKHEIEKRVDELERLETRDKIQFEQKKKEFIEKLKELEKTQLRNQGLQKKWEEAVQRTSNQEEQRYIASITCDNAKKEVERILTRIKKACQTDRELLQKIWLKSASNNYKDWSLPDSTVFQVTENSLDTFEEIRKSEQCEPPLQRLEEIETRGRNLRLREAMMTSSSIAEIGTKPVQNSFLGTIQNLFSKSSDFSYSTKSNLDQVQEWVQRKQEHPTLQDQERWEVREKMDQLQAEISAKRKELKDNSAIEGEMRKSNEMEDDDGRSRLSTATKQTISSKSSSVLSVSKRSTFSFGGGTSFGGSKKQPTSPLPSINEEAQDPHEKLKRLQVQVSELKNKYFALLDQAENERLSLLKGQKAAISFSEETDRNYAWEEADRKSVAAIQKKRREEELEKIIQEEQERWQTNTERWRLRAQADQALKVFKIAQERTITLGEEARKARTAAQLTEADRKKDVASAEEKQLKQAWLAAEEAWEKSAQEYLAERLQQSISQKKNNTDANRLLSKLAYADEVQGVDGAQKLSVQELLDASSTGATKQFAAEVELRKESEERLKERDQAVNKRWEKLLKSYQHPELKKSAVEQEELGEAIMALETQLDQAYRDSFITYSGQEALVHYKEVAFKRALENARNHPEEMTEAWEKIGIKEKETSAQLEINKQAAEAFGKEAQRLEKIEKIWKGILEREQQEAKQIREQAAQEYYRGNLSDWNALSEKEQTLYNNEVSKANEEYNQKREETKTHVTSIEQELQELEKALEIVRNKRKGDVLSSSKKRHDQQLLDLGEQKNKLITEKKQLQKHLDQQAAALNLGGKSKQKENCYKALTQSQNSEEKANERSGKNPYWKKAAECYRKASTYWKEASDDKILEPQQKQNEKIALSYGKAAESYENAAQEHAALLTTQNQNKEALVSLYNDQAKGYQQLAQQQEKGESISDSSETYDIQEALYQLEKQIERYLGTRGAQIEELQENIPLLKKRLEELQKEIATLYQQGQEPLALKKEKLSNTLQELIESCQKALEDLRQEAPESNERAAATITSIQSQKAQDQQLQQLLEQTLQLKAKILPLEQRVTFLSSEITVAQGLGEHFLIKGQQQLLDQLNQAIGETKKIQEQLLAPSEDIVNTSNQLPTCMSALEQVEKQDHYFQQIAPQLRSLDQNKTVLTTRIVDLKNSIAMVQSQGDEFLVQGQEKLLSQASAILSEIDPTADQLLAKNEKASKQANDIFSRITRFQQEDKALQENADSLRELGQKKISLKKREESLKREIIASQSRGEILLNEGQKQLLDEIAQALSTIEQVNKQILTGENTASQDSIALLVQIKQLEGLDQFLKKNAPTLLALEQKKNFFLERLKDLTAKVAISNSTGKNSNYLSEAQEVIFNEITQLLSKIDQNAQQLLTSTNEAPAEAKLLLTQLEELVQRDKELQKNAPDLLKLDEKKQFFQNRLEALTTELKSSQNQQHHLAIEKQQALISEINQALAKIDQRAKQLLSHASDAAEETSQLLSQLDLLAKREQRLQQNFLQLKEVAQKESILKTRVEVLENEMITSQIRGEITLAQAQKTLLEEINKILQTTSLATKQLLSEDQESSEAASRKIQELIPLLDELLIRDERLQENALPLRDLEQKKKLLQERLETLRAEIIFSEKAEEPLLAQQQQTFLDSLQRSLDKASEITTQLMAGMDHSLEQAKAFFSEVDQLQQQDRQLQEKILKVQELQQKKNNLAQRFETLSSEISVSHNQGEVLIAQGQQILLDKVRGILPRIDEIIAQLRKGSIGRNHTSEQASILFSDINQLEQRDNAFQQNITQLKTCLKKGNFLHIYTATLQEKINSFHSSQDPKEQFLAKGQQKILDDYRRIQSCIEEVVKQLLSGNKEASEQAKTVLTEINKLEQREQSLQKSIPTILDLEQKSVALQARAESIENDIISSKSREETIIAQCQQTLLEAIQEAIDHASECITQLLAGINGTQELTEIQRRTQVEATARIITAEKALEETKQEIQKETERIATEILKLQMELQEKALEATRQSSEARLKAQTTTGTIASSWRGIANISEQTFKYWTKASDAHNAQKKLLVKGYREAAETSQRAADQHKLALQTKIEGKQSEALSWSNEGQSLQKQADYQAKACEAQDIGKEILALGYQEAAVTSQKAADQYRQAAQTKVAGKENEGTSWGWKGLSLQAKADYEAKASEAQEAEKITLAIGYREAAAISQKAADQWKLSAERKAAGKVGEGVCWGKEGESLQAKADYQAKAIEAQEAGKKQLAEGYREAAAISQRAADQRKLSAQTIVAGKQSEAISLSKESDSLQSKADYQAKASEAQEVGKTNLAAAYHDAATTSQRAADQRKQAVRTKALGKESEGHSLGWEGTSLQTKADYQAKASEAQEAGKTQLAASYREAAAISQRAADQHKQAAQTKAAGKEDEGTSWGWEGASLQTKADYQAKASEAEELGKTMLARGYREASIISQRAADQCKLAAQTHASGKKEEGFSWDNEGNSLRKKAEYQAKISGAQEAGKTQLAEGYREASIISQRAADQYKQSALAKAAGRKSEYTRLWEAGEATQAEADAIAKKAEGK